MDRLLDVLPKEMIKSHMFQMLAITDVGSLDTAITNRILRPRFKEILRGSVLICRPFYCISTDLVEWMYNQCCTFDYFGFKLPTDQWNLRVNYLLRSISTKYTRASSRANIFESVAYIECSIDLALLVALSKHFPNLQRVRVTLFNSGCDKPFIVMPNLTELHISSPASRANLLDGVLQKLLPCCPNLRCLKFPKCKLLKCCHECECYCISQVALEAALINCPFLQEVDIPRMYLSLNSTLAVDSTHSNLTKLSLALCDVLTDTFLHRVVQLVPNLHFLQLSSNPYISSEAIIRLLPHLRQLRTLIVSDCFGVGDTLLHHLAAQSNITLTELDVSFCDGCSAVAVDALRNAHPSVRITFYENIFPPECNFPRRDILTKLP